MRSGMQRRTMMKVRLPSPSARRLSSTSSYVVVGAGSAGCTLVRRLLEQDATCTVTLVETGRWDRGRVDSWTIRMPAALTYNVADRRYNYDYFTVPQKGLHGRVVHEPRGKALGGSSSINAMVYIRGHALDFERWATKEGAGEDWDYASVLPYFKRAQAHADRPRQDSAGDGEGGAPTYRGYSGPLHVKSYSDENVTNELFRVFRDAGVQAGYPKTPDVNGYSQEGFGPFDMTISPNGVRCSASVAYLHPVLADPAMAKRLRVVTSRQATRINMDGKRAVGVTLGNGAEVLKADREVILCAGAIGSPQLLMLSGIGPRAHLRDVGIDTIVDNEGVGANLQDHLEVYVQYHCTQPVTLYPVGNWTLRYLHRRAWVGVQWFLQGSGIAASNQFEMGGFIRTKPGVQHPDVQYHFIPGAVLGQLEFLPYHAFQVHVGTLRPTSRGTLRLASKDPTHAPLIDPNFLATPEDVEDMRLATRFADEIVQQKAFDAYRGARFRPAQSEISDIARDDDKLDEWIRESSHSAYHPSCTCAMGSVVDSQGRVLGAEALRVVDASIMPSMTSGNLNAPTIMIAEKLADRITGRAPLPKELDVPFYVNPEWRTRQR